MTLDQLRVFCTAARCLNFTAAAAEMRLTPSAVSQHILALERSLELSLFERNSRRVALTLAGKHLLDAVEVFLRERECAGALQESPPKTQGKLLLGNSSDFGTYALSRFLSQFRQQYPDVVITMVNGSIEGIVEQLLQRYLDLALIASPQRKPLCVDDCNG